MKLRTNRCRYFGVSNYFIITPERYFLLKSEILNWKKWIVTGTTYIILRAKLRIKKQMWLMFF